MKILIPGGHLTPALAMIDWLLEHQPQVETVFVGRRYSQIKLKQYAIEEEEILKRGLKFVEFNSVQGAKGTGSWFITAWGLLVAVIKALSIIKKQQPSAVLSFGGYLAVPLVIAAKICKIPVVAHEGTLVLGQANQLIFQMADKVAYAFPDIINFDQKKYLIKSIFIGTPLRKNIIDTKNIIQPEWFAKQSNTPILLVLGGNQGSLVLNNFVKKNLKQLTAKWTIIHQCGRSNKHSQYKEELLSQAKIDLVSQDIYYVLEWIDGKDLAWFYQNAQLVLSRSGINTLEEIIYHQVPSILIPLPHSNYQEQERNAKYLQEQKAALVLNQDELTLENFLNLSSNLQQNYSQIREALGKIDRPNPIKAATQLFKAIVDLTTNR